MCTGFAGRQFADAVPVVLDGNGVLGTLPLGRHPVGVARMARKLGLEVAAFDHLLRRASHLVRRRDGKEDRREDDRGDLEHAGIVGRRRRVGNPFGASARGLSVARHVHVDDQGAVEDVELLLGTLDLAVVPAAGV